MAYQAADQKKEDFRQYLDKAGVIDSLTKALVGLYEEAEKPENPLEYLKTTIAGGNMTDTVKELDQVKQENKQLKEQLEALSLEIKELKLQQQQPNLKASADTVKPEAAPEPATE